MDDTSTDAEATDDRFSTTNRRRVLGTLGLGAVVARAGCTGGRGDGGTTTDPSEIGGSLR